MDFARKVREIDTLVEAHTTFRERCLNLIASETRPSPLVERLIVNDLDHRYGSYTGIDPRNRGYPGNAFLTQIEEMAQNLAKQLFGAAYVDLRPLSGNIAGLIALFALASPGDTVIEAHNGHMYAAKLANSGLKVDLNSIPIPWDGLNSNIDLDRTVSLIREHRPALVSIGSAQFLFPQPVRELREAMDRYCRGSFLVYDAAHVMGLIAGGRFQSPLAEGADAMVTSTHKTLAGPQGGMVLTNDRDVAERIAKAISPLMIANHHLSRLPSLAGTFLEWMACGEAHADAIVGNAKALGRAFHEQGVPMVGADRGYTESHTVLPVVDAFGESGPLVRKLEACHILVNAAGAPEGLGRHGLRIGVQEVTRYGMTESDAPEIAGCILDVLSERDPEGARDRAMAMARRFDRVRFTLPETDPAQER